MTAPPPAPEQTRTPGAAEQAPVVPGAPVIKKTERPHPATPLIRGWLVLIAIVVYWARDLIPDGEESEFERLDLRWILSGIAVLVVIAGVAGFFTWYFTRFVIDDEELRIETGAIFKKSKKIPFERLQSVDIIQPLAARIFGLAELRLEAGAGDSTTKLRYLTRSQASRLRDYLLARAHGEQASIDAADHAEDASRYTDLGTTDKPLVTVTPDRLVLGLILSSEWLVTAWQSRLLGAGIVGLMGACWWLAALLPRCAEAQASSPFNGMVEIPGGTFSMGRDDGPASEQPAHQAFVPTFYMDRNLVTVAEFATFVQAKGPTGPQGEMYLDVADPDSHVQQHSGVWMPVTGFEQHPVGEVSWHGAVAYCQWRQKRLASEAEWEKAARGTDGRLYPWGNHPPQPDLAFFGGWRGQTVPVGQYPRGASPYGVLDMAGQVWQWTTSIYKPYPYDRLDGREDLSVAAARVTRGGSSASPAEKLTATTRDVVLPSRQATGHAYIGFRCVKPLEMMSHATAVQRQNR